MTQQFQVFVKEELVRKQLRCALGKAQVTMGRAMLTDTKLNKHAEPMAG